MNDRAPAAGPPANWKAPLAAACERLGGEDAAWLHMEDASNAMVVSAIVDLQGRLPMAVLAERVAERVASVARFRDRVVEPRFRVGVPRWEPAPHFAVADQLEHVNLESAGDDALQAFVGATVSTLLDRSRPLWRLYAIDRPGAGTTLLLRFHHAIADGFALLAALLGLCDEGPGAAGALPYSVTAHHELRGYVAATARVVGLPPDPKTSLKGELGTDKRVAWTAPLALSYVKDLAHREGATVNDVLVAAVAGAVRRELQRNGYDVPTVRAMVPVNLRTSRPFDEAASGSTRDGRAPLGNRFGLVMLELPVGIDDTRRRVAAVHERMNALKATREPVVTFAILRAMGWAPRAVEEAGVAFFGTKTSLVLTNVPGPHERLHIASIPVTRVLFWVPQSGHMGLGVSIFSYAGEVTVGVMADARVVGSPVQLARDVEAELTSLARASVAATAPR